MSYTYTYQDFDFAIRFYGKSSAPISIWKRYMLSPRDVTSEFYNLEYFSGLLCVYYGATREDIANMTIEERLAFIHLFGN